MTDHLTAVIICALAVALAIGCYARERDADREAARALAHGERCADLLERLVVDTGECLDRCSCCEVER